MNNIYNVLLIFSFVNVLAFSIGENSTINSISNTSISPKAIDKNKCQNGNAESGTWESIDESVCNITIEEGYKIKITIKNFYLYSNDTSFVKITPGKSSDGKSLILTWKVSNQTYLFPTNNLLMELKLNENRTEGFYPNETFSIHWEKYGNKTITTEAPSSTESYPTPNPNSSVPYYYTAYLFGKNPENFTQDVIPFKTLLVNKGNQYCKENNIPLNKNITLNSIDITLAIRCLYIWPNAEKCVEIHFAIPVFVKNSKKYELSYDHLKDMWSKISESELKQFTGWTKYSTPDDSFTLVTWLLICFGIIFVALLSFVTLQFLGILKLNRRPEDVQEHQVSQNPININNFYQPTPQLFENIDYGYTQIHAIDNPAYVHDDLSDDERFNINQIRSRHHGSINQ